MNIKSFLQSLKHPFYQFILKHGKYFKGYRCDKRLIKKVEPKPKECFNNALKLCLISNGKYEFYQGYMLSPDIPIPIEHAWNVKDGKVIDLTACILKLPKDTEYFGVKIPYSFLVNNLKEIKASAKSPLLLYWICLSR